MARSSQQKSPPDPVHDGLGRGIAWWVLFSVTAVVLRGVRWDENFEFAQAMIGAVPYPAEHPLMQYTRSAFNGQFMTSAIMLELFPHPAVLNGFRNILFVLATTVPGYLLGHVMGRRPLAGHVTALMLLIGVHLDFDGSYPQFIWPGMFSNGHIGTGYVLAWVALTSCGYFRIAALMLGLMPLVHLGQVPPALLFAGGLTLYALALDRELWKRMKPGLRWFAGGIALCVIVYGIHRFFVFSPVSDGPYFSDADPRPIWQGRIQYWDMHRQIALGGIGMVLVFSTVLGVILRSQGSDDLKDDKADHFSPFLPLFYGLMCVVPIVLTIMIFHAALGNDVSYLLIGWLPYRLLNQLPPILTAACAAVLLGNVNEYKSEWLGKWIPGLLLLAYLLRPLAAWILSNSLYIRYVHQPTAYLFVLTGAAFTIASLRFVRTGSKDTIIIPVVAGMVALGYTALYHQFGAACLLLGAASIFATYRLNFPSTIQRLAGPVTGVLIAVTIGSVLFQEWRHREHLPVGSFEQDVKSYLKDQGEPTALLVGQPEQVLLQAQTGHPVAADMATAFHASYMPSLGPSVQKLYSEIYGIRFDLNPSDLKPWGTVWEERSPTEWLELGQVYEFRYVAAPSHLTLQLDSVIQGELDALYRIGEQ